MIPLLAYLPQGSLWRRTRLEQGNWVQMKQLGI